jgi:RNA polymerase sigma factor (sigma-70 family)
VTAYSELSDKDLLDRLREINQSNLMGLAYQRYRHLVLGTCLYYLKDGAAAQDAAMHIFENLIRNLHKYEIENLKLWLLQVTRNHFLKQITRVIKKENKLINKNIDTNFVEIAQEEDHNNEVVFADLENALETLKEHQQKCIVLFYLKGKSYEEISSVTGYEIKKVKSYIQNGKLNLGKQLHRHNDWQE